MAEKQYTGEELNCTISTSSMRQGLTASASPRKLDQSKLSATPPPPERHPASKPHHRRRQTHANSHAAPNVPARTLPEPAASSKDVRATACRGIHESCRPSPRVPPVEMAH